MSCIARVPRRGASITGGGKRAKLCGRKQHGRGTCFQLVAVVRHSVGWYSGKISKSEAILLFAAAVALLFLLYFDGSPRRTSGRPATTSWKQVPRLCHSLIPRRPCDVIHSFQGKD